MKNASTPVRWRHALTIFAAVLVGLSVPASQIGIALTTASLAAACAAIALRGDLDDRLRDVWRAVRSPLGLAVAIVFVAWLPSLPGSIDPAKSVEVWLRMIAYLGLGTVVWSFLRAEPDATRLCAKVLIVAACLTVILVILNFSGLTELIRVIRLKEWEHSWAAKTMKHYASSAVCLIPVVLYIAHRLGGHWRTAAIVASIGFVAFIHLTLSNAALIGIVGGTAFAAAAVIFRGRLAAMLSAYAVFIAGTLAVIGWIGLHTIDDYRKADDYPMDISLAEPHRQAVWNFALGQFPTAPWFGLGIDAANKVEGGRTVVVNPYGAPQELLPSHPHNWMVEVLVETGAIGLAAMLLGVGFLFASIFRPRDDGTERDLMLARSGLFGAFFVSSLFNFSFWASWWQIVFIVLWAIVGAMPSRAGPVSVGPADAGTGHAAPPPESGPPA